MQRTRRQGSLPYETLFYNPLLFGLHYKSLHELQLVQESADCIITQSASIPHVGPAHQ